MLAGCASGYPPVPPSPPPGPPPAGEPPISGELPDTTAPDAAPPARPRGDASTPTLALLRQSERSAESGDLDSAIAYVERAIRLNSRDPALWLRLARLQLAAERPARAEQLAQKAIALAERDDQQRQGWLLVADAREALGDHDGAERIRARWRTYRG